MKKLFLDTKQLKDTITVYKDYLRLEFINTPDGRAKQTILNMHRLLVKLDMELEDYKELIKERLK